MVDFSVQKWNILLCLTKTTGFSVHPLEQLDLLDEIDEIESITKGSVFKQ